MNLSDGDLAALLAEEAGSVLLEIRQTSELRGKALGDAGDRTANEYLCRIIREHRPDDGILSEESDDTIARLEKSRVWVIDPVDGTREYGEGRTDWAVHVGLSINGAPALGAVALPGLDLVLRSDSPGPPPERHTPPRMVVSRTRPAKEALHIAELFGARLMEMGSAGAKAMAVVRGEADIYLHSGGQYQWDNCAPVAVALAHGLHCSRIDGSPLTYNQADTYLPDLLICHKADARDILAGISALA